MAGLCDSDNEPVGSLKASCIAIRHLWPDRSPDLMPQDKHPVLWFEDISLILSMRGFEPRIARILQDAFAEDLMSVLPEAATPFGDYLVENYIDSEGSVGNRSDNKRLRSFPQYISYPAFARIGLRENPGKNLNQITCPDRDSNPGHLVSQPDALTVTPQVWTRQSK
ncbi:hypothetical protein ANN_14113 [Periplaneta americana]|uniref:Uncharacterized protein n=1 Tax=Periplaneta americana TaxID=6978 RepID=A0ABQ8SVE5_PERAM|nr:hypothetical protein ANN_14113 [Periplaneta americana]